MNGGGKEGEKTWGGEEKALKELETSGKLYAPYVKKV